MARTTHEYRRRKVACWTDFPSHRDCRHRRIDSAHGVLDPSEGNSARDDPFLEANMHSPLVVHSEHPSTPENVSSPILYDSRSNRGLEGWGEMGWFLKHEDDGLKGYLFTEDSEVRHGFSD